MMKQVALCFKNITRENVSCPHSTCQSQHRNQFVRNETCSHGNLENSPPVDDIIDNILTHHIHNEEEANEEINSLLAAIFILDGGCFCRVSYKTLCFFVDILGESSQTVFNILIKNWLIKFFLEDMPGLWCREEAFRMMIINLISKNKLERVNELYAHVCPIYNVSESGIIPYIFEALIENIEIKNE